MSDPSSRLRSGPGPLALPVILLAQLVIPMSIAGTAVALPAISDELGAVPWQLQGVVNGFNLVFALMTLFWGALADRVGHDRTFRAGIAIALLGALGSLLAPSLLLLDAARVVAGIGAAAVLTGASAILSGGWSGAARARAFALFGTANGLGLALGPSVSGALVELLGWRGVFGAQALMLVLALLGSGKVPRVRAERPTADGRRPPILDLSLLARPGFTAMLLVPVAGAVGFVTLLTYLPNALGAVRGLPAGAAGAMMLLATAPVVLSPLGVGALLARTRLRSTAVLLASFACLVLGALGLLLLAPGAPLALVIAPMVLIGLGFGLPLGLVDAEALAQVPESSSGSAAGLLNFVRIGAEAVAVAAYSAVLAALISGQLPSDAARADRVAAGHPGAPSVYAAALHQVLVGIAVIVVATAIAFAVLRTRAARTGGATADGATTGGPTSEPTPAAGER
ncbi:MFS transporter [Brachybacterium sp. ACRRE]|uniref:MFS transporter n=1 Tax=Brachybacterium sp. ACRRE TaxID=2918184 RepID=UPI001EF2E998|nr:MFS transporter [Brachybacterium sp. ACRRE]MCG7310845.1 MFS transporter [Brachybacterium sp. ACRRE]